MTAAWVYVDEVQLEQGDHDSQMKMRLDIIVPANQWPQFKEVLNNMRKNMKLCLSDDGFGSPDVIVIDSSEPNELPVVGSW